MLVYQLLNNGEKQAKKIQFFIRFPVTNAE